MVSALLRHFPDFSRIFQWLWVGLKSAYLTSTSGNSYLNLAHLKSSDPMLVCSLQSHLTVLIQASLAVSANPGLPLSLPILTQHSPLHFPPSFRRIFLKHKLAITPSSGSKPLIIPYCPWSSSLISILWSLPSLVSHCCWYPGHTELTSGFCARAPNENG